LFCAKAVPPAKNIARKTSGYKTALFMNCI
jgi:hypothetical protein